MDNIVLPHVICLIMGSVDGRILTERWTAPFNGTPRGELMAEYAAIGRQLGTDAWMFGKRTLCEGFFSGKFQASDASPALHNEAYVAPRSSKRLFITIDPDADILYDTPTVRGDDIATILPSTAPAEYLEHLRENGISYLFAGRHGDDLRTAMLTLATTFGVKSISLQGGGIINGSMLQAGLIDELSLVVYPGIDGMSGSTSIFEYTGNEIAPAKGQSLELLSATTRQHGVLWLRYKFHKS